LITVIVVLGILATSVTSFIGFGTKSYNDAADRNQLLASARFAIERLNREVRQALPNSLRTLGVNQQCLEFVPIDQALIYDDIPVSPEVAANSINAYMLDTAPSSTTNYVSIYALDTNAIYNKTSGIIEAFSSLINSGDKAIASTINFASAVLFSAESPTQRLYLIDNPVSYCVINQQLLRYQNYSGYTNGVPNGQGTLMAKFLANFPAPPGANVTPFQTLPATLQRNALAQIRLKFFRNSEDIIFNTEIQVPNVP
jgi:MSHA biogenesis protein MshO